MLDNRVKYPPEIPESCSSAIGDCTRPASRPFNSTTATVHGRGERDCEAKPTEQTTETRLARFGQTNAKFRRSVERYYLPLFSLEILEYV